MVQEGRLDQQQLESLVAAIQDLGVDSDNDVINSLALNVSDVILRVLRKIVGTNHPNRGEDIIYEYAVSSSRLYSLPS